MAHANRDEISQVRKLSQRSRYLGAIREQINLCDSWLVTLCGRFRSKSNSISKFYYREMVHARAPPRDRVFKIKFIIRREFSREGVYGTVLRHVASARHLRYRRMESRDAGEEHRGALKFATHLRTSRREMLLSLILPAYETSSFRIASRRAADRISRNNRSNRNPLLCRSRRESKVDLNEDPWPYCT